MKVRLSGVDETAVVERTVDGTLRFRLRTPSGAQLLLSPDELAARIYAEERRRSWWARLLNVTSPIGIAWVALGFCGQLLFTSRMVLQWLVSERQRRSVVPATFWWLSLVGATMLLVYFVWRRDVIGVLGQAFGWVVYLRNLWLIRRGSTPQAP